MDTASPCSPRAANLSAVSALSSSSDVPPQDFGARPFRVGVIYYGDAERRRTATPESSKVPSVFPALAAEGIEGMPVVYQDDFRESVREQLLTLDAALVWVNPFEDDRDRTHLDALLRDVARAGIFVSAHPDIILKIGTKQVLFDTRTMSWSTPGTQIYRTPHELKAALNAHVASCQTRVLKQYRGHSGKGIWKVEPQDSCLRVREAPRGNQEQLVSVEAFVVRCAEYFLGDGRIVDQAYQTRLPEGMIRCYLVHDKVEGFGHQAVNALCPAPQGASRDSFPATTRRVYYTSEQPEFQAVKKQLECEWLPQLQDLFSITPTELPVLWDCDFLFGPKTKEGADTYFLCEINVSSVSPFPDSVLAPMAKAVRKRLMASQSLFDPV